MPSLQSTDLAAVSTGSKLYLYYQNDSSIHEAHSDDGSSWTTSSTIVGEDCNPNGSAITAYHMKNDGSFGKKETIHVFYMDHNGRLREQVKVLSEGDTWKQNDLPDDIKKEPIPTSRLSSGICHDNSNGAHQWVYFEKLNTDSGKVEVAEIRNGKESSYKWVYRKILPQNPAEALPGTSLAANLTDPRTNLFFQDHEGNLVQYSGGYEQWNNKIVMLKKEQVQISTPLTTCDSSKPDKPHVFYVSKVTPPAVEDFVDGESTQVARYVPGTRLGAATLKNKTFLFFKPLTHPVEIWTHVYDGSSWGIGSKVVA
ncbi:hypothetical protein CNMCM5623_008128 [Aspergillus felis]|uniref:Fucose-specific lectin n=1 Tax=Aspergillus felis TaxID=1287682 RepID=A0A8H6V2B3_9EURO|nr:hypothetical protein CNMCM5623_008128 [Aspergillus felis]KAF7175030.1 hypothetical protein CNMCM7691_005498 [Aspergillus felis]